MGVAQSVSAMFPHKSLLYVCTVALTTSSPQSYFHNFGNQGTYTSVNHGSTTGLHHQPLAPAAYKPPNQAAYIPPSPAAYKQPAPAYAQPAYHAPAPTINSFYHAPVARTAAYHAALPQPYVHHHQPRPSYHHSQPHSQPQPHAHPQPHAQPRPHGPGIEYDREKCAVDYVEKKAEVCVPTFQTDCEREDVRNGLVIKQQEECYQVTKTICTETEEIVPNNVNYNAHGACGNHIYRVPVTLCPKAEENIKAKDDFPNKPSGGQFTRPFRHFGSPEQLVERQSQVKQI